MLVGLGFMLKTRLGLFIAIAMIWLGLSFAMINFVIEPAIELLRGAAQNAGGGGVGEFSAAAAGYIGIL
jgi:hypothetical protein